MIPGPTAPTNGGNGYDAMLYTPYLVSWCIKKMGGSLRHLVVFVIDGRCCCKLSPPVGRVLSVFDWFWILPNGRVFVAEM